MTDKTDIAALKKQIDTAADIIRNLTDKLEAERQRADELWRLVHVEASSFANERVRADKLAAHIETLKGELANPVVLSDCSFEAVSHMAHWYSEGECVAWVSGAEHVKKQILEAGFTVKEQ